MERSGEVVRRRARLQAGHFRVLVSLDQGGSHGNGEHAGSQDASVQAGRCR